jgi:hypothetical protein
MRLDLNRIVLIAAALLVLLGGPWFVGQLRSLPAGHHLAARAGQRILTVEVLGMRQPAVSARLEAGLRGAPGITAAEVRPDQDRVYAVVEGGVADSALVGAIERAAPGVHARVVQK